MNVFEYLDQSNAHYAVSEHAPTYSAQVMAAEEHEKGQYVAKPVIVKAEGSHIMCVLAAPDKVVFDKLWGLPPALDMDREKRVHEAMREILAEGLAESAHDLSDGGLAVALAECCFGPAGVA